MEIFTRKGLLISRSDAKGSPVNLTPGKNRVGIDLAQIPLLDGIYDVNIGVVDPRAIPSSRGANRRRRFR